MRNALITLLAMVFIGAGVASAGENGWKIDNSHSEIGFGVKHLGVSTVKGAFKEFSGTVAADDKGMMSSISGEVKVGSIDTRNSMRDDHLKKADFFDAEKFPVITFKSTSVKIEGTACTVTGDLTIRDIAKSITLTGEYNGVMKANFGEGDSMHSGYNLSGTINRQDFGLKFSKIMDGMAVVGDEVKIEFILEIAKSLPAAK